METFREVDRRQEKGWKHSEKWIEDKKQDGYILEKYCIATI